jgi:hypothetical protein
MIRVVRWMMTMMMFASSAVAQPPLALSAYEQPDGAITVFSDGRFVEPYFAMRALLTAGDLGLETEAAARRFIAWQLTRLEIDTTFRRSCRTPGSAWTACGSVDADDATLALWLELLYRTAGTRPLPAAWRRSAARSEAALSRLYDRQRGVYVVSPIVPVSLFMDNVEILAAFETVARRKPETRRRAARLRRAIQRVFWNADSSMYRVSTQASATPPAFYPGVVAQLFPAVFGYGSPLEQPRALVARWMADHGREWLTTGDQEYSWGLLAAAAVRSGDRPSATCWLGAAMSRRHGARWNVLEEAVYQALSESLAIGGAPPPCTASWSGVGRTMPAQTR